MTFEIIKVAVNAIHNDCFDLSILNNDTKEVVIFEYIKIWEEFTDQQSLQDMFYYDESLDE